MVKNKFSYTVSLEADSEADAVQKMKAATSLMKNLSTRELARLAEVVEKEPGKVKLAKNFLGLG